ncbi:hypothetical protein [Mycolicibacterium cosmeticum]|uniref:hypothetical protein n=1 Tax=Mycolicibacterium cosmeticum TaxID=258533 RepID=UPI003204F33B
MKRFVITTMTTAALAGAAVGLAGAALAAAAAAGPTSPDAVIHQLEAKGYEVVVTRTSGNESGPCSVAAVRPGQTFTGKSKEIHGVQSPVAVHKTMYVDLRC